MHPRDLLPLLKQAASVVIVLVWIYYSACILFFGAEITKGYARRFGSGVVPNSHAVLVDDLLRARLGLSSAMIEAASTPPSELPADDCGGGL